MRKLPATICLTLAVLLFSPTEGWSLPPCPEDPSRYYDNCFGTFSADGDKYVGEWKDNKQHGQGTFTFADGDKYVGEFRDDKFHGQGTYTFADGDKYVGKFRDGKRHGQGTYYAADGTVVGEGYFEDGELMEDRGTSYAAQSDLLPCPEDPSKYYDNCFGTFSASGWKYVGEWKDNKKHGQGTYTYAGGDKYVGEFRDDKYHGQGTYTSADGHKYVGEFRDDNFHGQGTYTYADGHKYVGEFRDDNFHGQGIRYAADGTVLQEGYWENDELVRSEKIEVRDTSYAAQSDKAEELRKELGDYYIAYITINECNKVSSQYIDNSQIEAAKSKISSIQDYYEEKYKNMDTASIWESSSAVWEEKFGGSFALFSALGVYSEELNGICRLQLLSFSTANVPGAEEQKRERDFD